MSHPSFSQVADDPDWRFLANAPTSRPALSASRLEAEGPFVPIRTDVLDLEDKIALEWLVSLKVKYGKDNLLSGPAQPQHQAPYGAYLRINRA